MSRGRILLGLIALFAIALTARQSHAQAFGVELKGSLMPASGGMGGTGIARPQDVPTSFALNTATLTQHKGTKFSFSGAWVEPTINIDNQQPIGGVIGEYKQKSQRPGSIVGNIAATQDYSALGLPVTAGVGLVTASGLGVNYRATPESNGTSAELVVLHTQAGVGAELTDRLSLGVGLAVSTATMDGVFSGQSAATPNYNLRANVGFTYDVRDETTIGGFWLSEEKHTFDDFIRFGAGPFQDLKISLPTTFGLGIADESLCCGKLLLGVDLLYFRWDDTDFFSALWEDQVAVQTGVQYTTDRGIRLRAGYTYAENVSRTDPVGPIGGVDPQAGADYIRALFPNINKNRISAGVGVADMLPGVDLDLFAGGQFKESQAFGTTVADIQSYWVGFGVTWRFRRGGCSHQNIPDQW
ncbi:MAG: OmpP1/FadL family transporter [Rubripirellula sp.]